MRHAGPCAFLLMLCCGAGLLACRVEGEASLPPEAPAAALHVLHQSGSKPLCIVTAFTADRRTYSDFTTVSHRRYAARHGYAVRAYIGRPSGTRFLDPARGDATHLRGGGLFWQKIDAVQRMLAGSEPGDPHCQWVMWVDDDVMFTNHAQTLEDLIVAAGGGLEPDPRDNAVWPATQVILSAELPSPTNAGVFLIKNSRLGRDFMAKVASMYAAYKDRPTPEQDAMSDLAYPGGRQQPHLTPPYVRVLAARRINAWHHPYWLQNPVMGWHPGDFIAHMVSSSPEYRRQNALMLLDAVPAATPP